MSNNGQSNNGTFPLYSDRGQIIQHDLRHALFTLRTGIALLEQVRDDPEKFAEVKQLLDHEVASASRLINDLLSRPDPLADSSASVADALPPPERTSHQVTQQPM